jgi:excisionase family DNA binding protein
MIMSSDSETLSFTPEHDELLTVRQTAQRLTISLASTYQLIRSGTLPHYRIGGAIRVTDSDIERFLAGCRRGQPAQVLVVPEPQRRPQLRHITLPR